MVKRLGGSRRKSRYKMKKNASDKGKISINRYLTKYNDGERVMLHAEPAVQDGLYHMRFHQRSGVIAGNQGSCYFVKLKDGNKQKKLLVHPIHLRKQN